VTAGEIAEVVAGGALVLVGIVSGARTMGQVRAEDAPGLRTAIVAHAAAKAGFWISIGAIFFAYAFRGELLGSPRVLFPIPLVMTGIRLLTAQALARRLPDDE
jgi:hypothetical protein